MHHSYGFSILLFFLLLLAEPTESSTFPNPQNLPGCREAIEENPFDNIDRICDPDAILSLDEARAAQMAAVSIAKETPHNCGSSGSSSTTTPITRAGFEVAVFLIKRSSSFSSSPSTATAATIAKAVHDEWGVGHQACQDGIVAFLAIDDRQLYISTGAGVKDVVDEAHIQAILIRARPDLRKGAYGDAVLGILADIRSAILQTNMHLEELSRIVKNASPETLETFSGGSSSSGVRGGGSIGFSSSSGRYGGRSGGEGGIGLMIRFGMFIVIACVMSFFQRKKQLLARRQAEEWQTVRNRLIQIEQAREQEQIGAESVGAAAAPAAAGNTRAVNRSSDGENNGSTNNTHSHTEIMEEEPEEENQSSDSDNSDISDNTSDDDEDENNHADGGARRVGARRRRNGGKNPGSEALSVLSTPAASSSELNSSSSSLDSTNNSNQIKKKVKSTPLAARLPCCPICLEDFIDTKAAAAAAKKSQKKEKKRKLKSGFTTTPGDESMSISILQTTDAGSAMAASAFATTTSSSSSTSTSVSSSSSSLLLTEVALPCKHRFHVECLDNWFGGVAQKNTCPVCRAVAFGGTSKLAAKYANTPAVMSGSSSSGVGGGSHSATTSTTTDSSSSSRSNYNNENDNECGGASTAAAAAGASPAIDPQQRDTDFLLYSMHRRYPNYITFQMLDLWMLRNMMMTTTHMPPQRFSNDPLFIQTDPVRVAAIQQQRLEAQTRWGNGSSWGGGGFGGGSSFGGGGGGGGW